MIATALPEVIRLRDARGPRPEDAAGIGEFWYDPDVWSLPISPKARLLYATLCSYLYRGEINHKDLRAALKGSTDEGISSALDELVRHELLHSISRPTGEIHPAYEVLSISRR